MTGPLVSVVVRSMGRPTLARALDSLARQDYPRIDVVVVNARGDGHLPPPLHAGPHAVRFVPGSVRRTRPQAANAGQDAAAGDWITFLDDDDLVLPTHISGLVAATARAGGRRFVHSFAIAALADGSVQRFGQPMALVELYRRNFIHMSSALWSRELVARGARFDERCTTHQDWDFFLQCAQQTGFHFEPLQTFRWHADIGESGSWGGGNVDDAQISAMCALIFAKWSGPREALYAAAAGLRATAAACAQVRDLPGALAAIATLLKQSQNDPYGLALRAMIERTEGNLDAALRTQTLAVAVRPQDARLLFGLATLEHARGQHKRARQSLQRVLAMAPAHPGATELLTQLPI